MAIAENTTLVRRFYEEVINSRALDAIDGMVATTFVHNGEARGPSGQRQAIQEILAAFPDVRVAIDDVVAEGDRVVARQTWRGTHQGTFMGIAPTGRSATWTGTATLRLADGQIAQAWVNEDDLGLLRQLGRWSRRERLDNGASRPRATAPICRS
jgi:predicted ester cyclase